jgi:hypothetical protein
MAQKTTAATTAPRPVADKPAASKSASAPVADKTIASTSSPEAMDGYQLVASLVGSLAWPIVVLVIFFVLRKQLIALVDRLKSAKIAGLEVELEQAAKGQQILEQEVKIAKEEVAPKQAQPEPEKVANRTSAGIIEQKRLEQLIAIDPSLAVLDVWALVEAAVSELAAKVGFSDKSISKFYRFETISSFSNRPEMALIVGQFRKLRTIRNKAAHIRDVTEDEALDFIELSHRFIELVRAFDPASDAAGQ